MITYSLELVHGVYPREDLQADGGKEKIMFSFHELRGF